MFKTAVGQSENPSAKDAVQEILMQIRDSIGDVIPQAGILLCAIDFDHSQIIAAIRNAYPGMELAGCTTDGEISSIDGFCGHSVVLMVFVTDVIEIRAGVGRDLRLHSREAGMEAALSAYLHMKQQRGKERFAIIFTDPLNIGTSDVDLGIAAQLGQAFPLIGAAAAAHSKQRATYQFYNAEILTDSVVILLFAGPVCFSFDAQGGYAPLGSKAKITASAKHVLYRIENEPALDFFQRAIGDGYNRFMNYCWAVFEEGRKGFYVRRAASVDPKIGSVTLNGTIADDAWIQIGIADKDAFLDSCNTSLRTALETYPGTGPAAALLFSSARRKEVREGEAVPETEIVQKSLKGIPFAGFYSFGEICPLERDGKPRFHDTTFVTLLIGESESIDSLT